jgi:transposase InsO family protein
MNFYMICSANGIEYRLTKPNHPLSVIAKHRLPGSPWTNGKVERMNRSIKDATVKRYHYENHDQLRSHISDFLDVYNDARRLKTLSGLTPCKYIGMIGVSEPDGFIPNPIHQLPGRNI